MSYKLQYASNFFLNLHKRRDFAKMLIPSSENLALLGNICSLDTIESRTTYNEFLYYCSSNYKNVYLIPGPWEMYSSKPQNYSMCINNLYSIVNKSYPNICILDNRFKTIPKTDIQLIGTMLWTQYPFIKNPCQYEFSNIWLYSRTVTGDNIVDWHLEDLDFLESSLNINYRSIVLTHHLPYRMPDKTFNEQRMTTNNLEKMMKSPIHIWLCGANDKSFTGTFGILRDVFSAINPYTTFKFPHITNPTYLADAYVSLRINNPQLV